MSVAVCSSYRAVRVAQYRSICRVCARPIVFLTDPDYPSEFVKIYGRTVICAEGKSITLNFGQEHSHTDCLVDRSQDVPSWR
jgi:hypothetical protein